MPEDMREGTITLPDGRALGYGEYGPPNGSPILHFHGLPGGRFYGLQSAALAAASARLLTVERPGIGLSDRKPGRTLHDWPADVTAFADALGIERFGVLGTSSGGPFAFATGLALPDRVTGIGLRCAIGPAFDHPEFDEGLGEAIGALMPLARQDPDVAADVARQFLAAASEQFIADPSAYFDEWVRTWPENDRPRFVAERARWLAILDASFGSPDGYADDVLITYGPWELELSSIQVPVRSWHGTADGAAPIELVRIAVDQAGGSLVTYDGSGHYLPDSMQPEMLAWLTVPN